MYSSESLASYYGKLMVVLALMMGFSSPKVQCEERPAGTELWFGANNQTKCESGLKYVVH